VVAIVRSEGPKLSTTKRNETRHTDVGVSREISLVPARADRWVARLASDSERERLTRKFSNLI
jgi:hypothetical protein